MFLRALAAFALMSCGASEAPSRVPAPAKRQQSQAPANQSAQSRIVFVRSGSIWMMDLGGEDAEQLTVRQLDAPDESPALSPSGQSLAYVGSAKGERHLFVMDMEMSEVTRLTEAPSPGAAGPVWVPDGRSIVFMQGDPRDALHLVRIDPKEPKKVQVLLEGDDDEPAHVGSPAISPDGKTIVFSADRRRGSGTVLWSVAIDGSGLRALSAPSEGKYHLRDRDPVFSPDGKRVIFASNRHVVSADHAEHFELYSIGLDGSGLTRITNQQGSAVHPTLSPDGKTVIYARSAADRPQESQLYSIPVAGGAPKVLTGDAKAKDREPSSGRAF